MNIPADAAARPRTVQQSLMKQIMAMPAGAILLVFVTLQIVCITGIALYPDDFRYLSPQNLTILMKAIPVLGCLALGAGMLMIAGEFDLSIGSVYTFTAVLMATLVDSGLSAFMCSPAGYRYRAPDRTSKRRDHAPLWPALIHRHARRPSVLARCSAALQRRRAGSLRS